jgi:heme-degrading monooxygenase HmoA
MIVRVFRARVHPGKEDEFERFVIETGVPMVRAAEGCTHVTAGKSRWNEQPEFVVVTHWRSVDALQAFAGPDWQKAVIEPQEEHMLAEVFCDHYETIETGSATTNRGTSGTLHSRGECRLVRSRT